jgi:5-bromo-4-chloroindolyl phosphate hydrolysis protein
MAVYSWAWIPIVSFILLSAFIVVNLVIAVICDAISEYQRKDIEEQLQAMSQQSLSSHSANDGAYTALQLKLEDTTRKVDELTALLHTLLQNPSRVTAVDPTPPMERSTATGERF